MLVWETKHLKKKIEVVMGGKYDEFHPPSAPHTGGGHGSLSRILGLLLSHGFNLPLKKQEQQLRGTLMLCCQSIMHHAHSCHAVATPSQQCY